ncbi:anoctamin-1-like isoform X2 [Chrysoperla carnea]|uniref:anoctamin-1-like isoform X2 n=1 Tax=Chrysoperla carnea TaxID=189513 RepID=UPI001D073E7E|nr:anoctamin-1-like isoform X2 [Chrysoperla carnea]
MDDTDDTDFYDTISVNSTASSRHKNRNSITQSRHTIYHSAEDLELLTIMSSGRDSGDHRKKNWNRFRDGERTVDFVLAYTPNDVNDHENKRRVFERNLTDEGLILEHEETQRLHFVKIHAPKEVLCRYCEILKLRMPIKESKITINCKKRFHVNLELPGQETIVDPSFDLRSICSKLPDIFNVRLDKKLFPEQKYTLTAEFSRDKDYLFDINADNFFTTSVKSMVVNFILERTKYKDDPQATFDVGIDRLLQAQVYQAAYPLHDGDHQKEGSMRALLFNEWAQCNKWIKYQPIDYIKDYFGVKYALYFAWLGFYTHMLIPASIFGVICVLYGLATVSNDKFSSDICNPNLNITMCPLCDAKCDYWNLTDACTFSRISYIFDNPFTIAFAVFMSFWAALYLELWKRYSAEITHRWGLTGFDLQAEHPRPQYLARLSKAKKRKLNVVTRVLEPVVPFWKVKFPSIILSFSVAILWIAIAIAAVFGVVIYRMSQITSQNIYGEDGSTTQKIATIPITAAILNLICILILNIIYDKLAVKLTEMEYQRTQTEYDDSLTLKIYMFQFVNYYSSIFYIAFLKGKFVGYPAKYNRIFGLRQEECSPGGCLMELFIQLAIIMIGNQFMSAVTETVIPLLMKWYNTFTIKTGLAQKRDEDDLICCNQWTEDYKLNDIGPRGLFDEYLEMVMQYGFITIFVVAFPLAPLLALINNVFEMRLDGKKFIKYYRRPVPFRVKNIGVWYRILAVISRIAVVSNAFILAFSSNFIPRLMYMLTVSPDHTDNGFLNHTLAYFDTSDFQYGARPLHSNFNVSMCRYAEFRNPPDDVQKYKRPIHYWHLFVARLAFVVIFQNFVGFSMTIVEWAIPDMSRKLRDQIKREAYLTNEIIIKQEALRTKGLINRQSSIKKQFENGNNNSPSTVDNSPVHHRSSNGGGDAPILDED